MSGTDLFSWTDSGGATQVLNVDVVMNAADKRTARMTDHVVETGAVITDHVVIQPETLSMELLVTQTPIAGAGMSMKDIDLDLQVQRLDAKKYPLQVPPSRFVPGGFLLATSALRNVITGAATAVLGAIGLGEAGGDGSSMIGSAASVDSNSWRTKTLQADTKADRVAEVHDRLIEILNGKLLVTVSFKGKLYVDYLLTEVELKHAAGKFGCGSFNVQARAFRTVTGVKVQLPDPADFRAKAAAKKGNKPAKTPDPDPTKNLESDLYSGGGDFVKTLKKAAQTVTGG